MNARERKRRAYRRMPAMPFFLSWLYREANRLAEVPYRVALARAAWRAEKAGRTDAD